MISDRGAPSRPLVVALWSLFLWTAACLAQQVAAEADYYPLGYSGAAWIGEINSVNEDTREFTLTYKKGDKEQTFVGVLQKGYRWRMADGAYREVKMADLLRTGAQMRIKAYYTVKTRKVNGQKVRSTKCSTSSSSPRSSEAPPFSGSGCSRAPSPLAGLPPQPAEKRGGVRLRDDSLPTGGL
ncbi:MAG: hypothetical protein ABSH46_04265 [Bryobacteraceae bacterium]